MLKYALLSSVLLTTAPAFAQDQATTAQAAPMQQTMSPQAAPVTADPAQTTAIPSSSNAPQPETTGSTTMSGTTAQASPAPQVAPAAPTAQSASQPANKADQVAAVVDKEFGGYDKDSNGTLSETEFASWMIALKTASDPSTKATDPAVKTWITGAFASADKDKSKSVSKSELTGFLAQG